MTKNAKFIWLNKEKYPNLQESCVFVFLADRNKYRFGVTAFKKGFEFDKKISQAEIKVPTPYGEISCSMKAGGEFNLRFTKLSQNTVLIGRVTADINRFQ